MEEVLKILEKDARTTVEQISTMTGIPSSDVEKVILQAEKNRTILKYKAIINWQKLGDTKVQALIEIKVVPQRDVGFDSIAERIYRFHQTRMVYLVSGAYDLAVLVSGDTMQDVAAFVAEKLAPLEFVQGTATHFVLKRYKEDGEILEGKDGIERLQVSM